MNLKSITQFLLAILIPCIGSAADINLHQASCQDNGRYGASWYTGNTYISILSKTYDKKVFLETRDGSTKPAEFVRSLGGNRELWKVPGAPLGSFKVGYEYYDNDQLIRKYDDNNGEYYNMHNCSGVMLGKDTAMSMKYEFLNKGASYRDMRDPEDLKYFTYKNRFTGYMSVKNLGHEKNISIIYSADNWQTQNEVQAQYNYTPWMTSAYGVEDWKFDIPDTFQDQQKVEIEFAVRYEVNGQTYWDNNFGNNYKITHIRRDKNIIYSCDNGDTLIEEDEHGEYILTSYNQELLTAINNERGKYVLAIVEEGEHKGKSRDVKKSFHHSSDYVISNGTRSGVKFPGLSQEQDGTFSGKAVAVTYPLEIKKNGNDLTLKIDWEIRFLFGVYSPVTIHYLTFDLKNCEEQ